MPTPPWFDDLIVLAEMAPEQVVKQLRALEDDAAEVLEVALVETDQGPRYVFDGARDPLEENPWWHTGHVLGYVAPADSVRELRPIVSAAEIDADSSLIHDRITLSLTAFMPAGYPGGKTHRVLFHFAAVNQLPDDVEHLHFNTSRKVESGEKLPNLDQPLFDGLTVGPRGLDFRYVTIKIKKRRQEKYLEFLESDVYRSGLRLLPQRQPAVALYSDMAYRLTERIRSESSATPIQQRHLALHLGAAGTGAPLLTGTYVAAQIPESMEIGWSWEEWVYHPASGRIVRTDDHEDLFGFNYLVFAVDRLSEPWELAGRRRGREAPHEAAAANGQAAPAAVRFDVPKPQPAEATFSDPGPRDAEVPTGAPVDLEIRVKVRHHNGRMGLSYTLHCADPSLDLFQKEIRGPQNLHRPQVFQADLVEKIERLNAGQDTDQGLMLAEEIGPKLARIGQRLYRILFPEELKAAYRAFRDRITTLQITSDEPWIPWELIKPYDPGTSPPLDDDFLGMRFQFTRWLADTRPPASEISVKQLACIEAGTVSGLRPLPNAAIERALLGELASGHRDTRDVSPPRATYEAMEKLLMNGGVRLLHFVGHGDFDLEKPDESSLTLVDRRCFRAEDVDGPLAAQVAKDRPLVFLNACRVGRQGLSLTGLGGWAEAWVRVANCGGFLGPQWAVRDELASAFARVFYRSLEGGRTFGQAAQAARRHVRKIDPNHATWVAFAVYAHPNGRLSF